MSAFSRLQLAAALLEYDNDLDNPTAPNRSAQESAIFLPFRQSVVTSKPRKTDYLGVPLAGDSVTTARSIRSNSALGHHPSRMSISTLHNPFGPDDNPEEEDENPHEEDLEVDLSSWGLDALIPKDKSSKGKGKEKSTDPLSLHSVSSVAAHQPSTKHDTATTGPRRALGASRSMSVGGNLEYFGTEGETSSSIKMDVNRRRSFGSPLDIAGMESLHSMQRRRASSSSLPAMNAMQSQAVPFPTSLRSGSLDLNKDGGYRTSSLGSRLDPVSIPERTRSTASADSRLLLQDAEEDPDSRPRTMSNATMATILLVDDNPFALRPPSRASRFDPKAAAHARTISNASMGSRMMLDYDATSVHTSQVPDGRDRRYSTTLDLLRPKVLVMPSPLQPTTAAPPPPNDNLRDGFELTTGPPLPPGARSSRRASATFSALETPPLASNSFTPNPLSALSLSQMTFRNTLKIDGQTDSYMDADLPRATIDGEQAQFEAELEDIPIVAVTDVDETVKTGRPAGKLFGKSLIDDLENRKAQMKNKQRVFTGDERPSMMARASNQRASTLIDPAALQTRPVSQHMNGLPGAQQTLGRHNSVNIKPLLTFDEDEKMASKAPGPRLPHGRSVFGVDTLWEKEMEKLKEIEAREKQEKEDRKSREEAQEAKKSKKKLKRKDRSKSALRVEPENLPVIATEPRVPIELPVLPDIPRAIRKPPPKIPNDASDSDDSDVAVPTVQKAQAVDPGWHAVSSDEDDGPRRTTGTGPRFLGKNRHRQTGSGNGHDTSGLKPNLLSPDSDDERPLSSLLQKKQSSFLNIDFDHPRSLAGRDEDEDNQPLGLRVSRLAPSLHANSQAGDDDDRPLAFHPEQQRRSQFQLMAAQQQQQQQLMMQAQMQNSMYFSPPSMMGSPFFGPPMMPMMMQAPMPIPSPPPLHDQAKFNRVDSWRRDVAVEGDS